MKVTNQMIHPQLRFAGNAMKVLTKVADLDSALHLVYKKHKHTKDMNCEEKYIARTERTDKTEDMRICIYRKHDAATTQRPCVLWIHGGGYKGGYPEVEENTIKIFVNELDCVVVSPDYCLSPEAPYPAALHDVYSALKWIKDNAEELNIDTSKIIIGGESAGGGLTAALAIYARDKKEVNVAFQIPLYPMIDDRMMTDSARDNNAPVWDSKSNSDAWKLYLGDLFETPDVPAYAAPARLEDFSGLPPAISFVGTIEPFHDETVEYFRRLNEAGIEASCREFEGCFHGFDGAVPKSDPAIEARNYLKEKFREYLNKYSAS